VNRRRFLSFEPEPLLDPVDVVELDLFIAGAGATVPAERGGMETSSEESSSVREWWRSSGSIAYPARGGGAVLDLGGGEFPGEGLTDREDVSEVEDGGEVAIGESMSTRLSSVSSMAVL
jgi:hypothetical protein